MKVDMSDVNAIVRFVEQKVDEGMDEDRSLALLEDVTALLDGGGVEAWPEEDGRVVLEANAKMFSALARHGLVEKWTG